MAAERPPWKAHVLAGVIEAGNLCVNARDRLISARRFWEEPMHVADAHGARRRIQLLRGYLTDVSGDLTLAMADMLMVQTLSLRAAAADPRAPLAGVEDIPDGNQDVRQALNTLRRAWVSAEAAHNCVLRGRGRLLTASLLLNYPDLPDVDDFIAAEQASAESSFEAATHLAAETVARVTEARVSLGGF